ncbi:hypothetical protein KP509_25G039200 [Ceratopteris richardii]|uniref:RIN4 pathogenic type III effector avirulence factor Avr cleavage site domain-containing protein n=1 Tax=Ceratopteris richardii TaxID=49495 RepID=A0A8T2RQG8_CERRI|nr:hypothetical protein KP509_25G039200 [Ceratopteris richardii]
MCLCAKREASWCYREQCVIVCVSFFPDQFSFPQSKYDLAFSIPVQLWKSGLIVLIMRDSPQNKEMRKKEEMHETTHLHSFQGEVKQNEQHFPAAPVSSKLYKKKDFEYLSSFPGYARTIRQCVAIRPAHFELSQGRSDTESDFFTTTSSIDYATSVSSASSVSSLTPKYDKLFASLKEDMEDSNEYQIYQKQDGSFPHGRYHEEHDLRTTETRTSSSEDTSEKEGLQKLNPGKEDSVLHVDVEDGSLDKSTRLTKGTVRVKEAHAKVRAKTKPETSDAPPVLPKFGSWDTKNPSSGDAYTLIFRRLRDEKQAGGIATAVSVSSTNLNEDEEVSEHHKAENKEREPLRSNHHSKKEPSGGKASSKPRQNVSQSGPSVR